MILIRPRAVYQYHTRICSLKPAVSFSWSYSPGWITKLMNGTRNTPEGLVTHYRFNGRGNMKQNLLIGWTSFQKKENHNDSRYRSPTLVTREFFLIFAQGFYRGNIHRWVKVGSQRPDPKLVFSAHWYDLLQVQTPFFIVSVMLEIPHHQRFRYFRWTHIDHKCNFMKL